MSAGVVPGLGAVVLCGGESSRMGRPKAWLPFAGEPLLARVAKRIAEAAAPVVVVAAPGQEVPPLPEGMRIVRDSVAGRGPLQGILAGLAALAGHADAAFVASTDLPFLRPELVRRLAALRAEGDHDAAAPLADGHRHPLAAVYRVAVAAVIAEALERDERRATFLLSHLRARLAGAATLLEDSALAAADPHLWSLRNINTPEQYAAALRDAAT